MPVTTKSRYTKPDIDEELRRLNRAAGMSEPPRRHPAVLKALGVFQILAGLFCIVFSYLSGAFLAGLLGAIITLAGAFQMIGAGAFRSGPAFLAGLLGVVAGIVIATTPVISIAMIGAIIGSYLIITGAFNMAASGKQGTSTIGGLIEIGIGGLVLLGFFGVGLLLGLYLLIRGAINYASGRTAPGTSS